MTSVAVFSKLRRTLTDVMEDELYHVPPTQQNTTNSVTGNQQINHQPIGSLTMNNYSWNNNYAQNPRNINHSPLLSHTKLYFKNNSALNSEELLTIPDHDNIALSKVPSHDMYYDVPENLPEDFNTFNLNHHQMNVFNEYADPNLTTTNGDFINHLPHPQPHQELQTPTNQDQSNCSNNPTKLLKFNDDLSLDYFNDDDSKFVIFPNVLSPDLIPEEIEDEELSEDEDEDEDMMNFSYLDDVNPNQLQLHRQVPLQVQQTQEETPEVKDQDITLEIESDIDKMSLASFQEYSSDSSIIDDDEDDEDSVPSFMQHSSPSQQHQSSSRLPAKIKKARQSSISNGLVSKDTLHQCHLINPSTGKSCMKQFSRPYDLIRHQETIHASRKKIFRCVVCNKLEGGLSKKTFSRGDALSRHVKVKHGLSGDDAINAIQYAKDHVEYL